MKNKGLLMIVLLLAFCCVLTGYAMTEGATERLEIDANEVNNVMYVANLQDGTAIDIDRPEYINRIVTELNDLELRKEDFKIAKDSLSQMSCLAMTCGDVNNPEDLEFNTVIFLPENRVLCSWGDKSGSYTVSHEHILLVADEIAEAVVNEDRYASGTLFIAFPEELLE